MTPKQCIHKWVDNLPEDSPLLVEICEMLRMEQALKEAVADIETGRIYSSEEFVEKIRERWPRSKCA